MKSFFNTANNDFFHFSSPFKEIDKQIEWLQLIPVMMTVQLVLQYNATTIPLLYHIVN